MLLSKILECFNSHYIHADPSGAPTISIEFIIKQKGVLIDQTTSVQILNDKFKITLVEVGKHFNFTALDQIHFFRKVSLSVDELSLFVGLNCHIKYEFIYVSI